MSTKARDTIFGLREIVKAFSEFKNIENEIVRYNRADTVNMSPNEMNKFRHIAASAYYVSKGYSEETIEFLGSLKEFYDLCKQFIANYGQMNYADRNFDLNNNKRGREIGRKFRYKNKRELFDYIFKTEIEPKRK